MERQLGWEANTQVRAGRMPLAPHRDGGFGVGRVYPGRLVAEATQPEFAGDGLERSCSGGTSPVSIGPCERSCFLCRCCCSRCRGIPARAARPVSATMGRANSVAARGSSIRKRKRRRRALRRNPSTSEPLGDLSGFAIQEALCESWYDCLPDSNHRVPQRQLNALTRNATRWWRRTLAARLRSTWRLYFPRRLQSAWRGGKLGERNAH